MIGCLINEISFSAVERIYSAGVTHATDYDYESDDARPADWLMPRPRGTMNIYR